MKKLNHYFQKVSLKSIVLILVATMLLTIPRMNVYSAIGDYQIASTAITANNNFQLYKDDKEKPIAVGAYVLMAIAGIVGVGVVVAGAGAAAVGLNYALGGFRVRDDREQHPIYPDHINYSKYDFSQFDNTTVR